MNTKNFVENYNLHGSLLENIEYDSERQTVKLTVEFCCWLQDNYKEGTSETGIIEINFINVSNFEYSPYKINSDEFTNVILEDKTIKFTLFNDIEDNYKNIYITCNEVKIFYLRGDIK